MSKRSFASLDELDEYLTRPPESVLAALEECEGDFVVLGAAGKMGFHLSRMLQRALADLSGSRKITVVSRFSSPESRMKFEDHGFQVIAADLSEPEQLDRVPQAENVLYLAGIKFGTSGNPELLKKMNATMPALVADRFRGSRIVALSTGCVYPFTTPESGGSTEQSQIGGPGEYAQSCLEREQAFLRGSQAYGTKCVLVRLNYSVDLRYGVLVDIAQQVKAGQPINLETGYFNCIWQGDAVAQILQCFPHASSPPFFINITGSKVLRVREIAERFAQQFDCEAQLIGQESSTCWLSNNAFSVQLFGEPQTSLDQMIDWIAAWLIQNGPTLGKPTQFQVRDGQY